MLITEYSLLVAIVSVLFAIYAGVHNLKRNERHDTEKEATAKTVIAASLETIGKGVSEIRHDVKEVRADMHKHSERLVIVEEHLKTAHKRIDRLENNQR